MPDATLLRGVDQIRVITAAAVAPAELHQLADGSAGVFTGTKGAVVGDPTNWLTRGQYIVTKTAGITILDGGRVYWDFSVNSATFNRMADRDFYIGRAVGDAASTDPTLVVNLNVDPPYDRELARDPFYTVATGTQALGGFLPTQRRGGALKLLLSPTSEAQKTDALAKDGFATAANAIVEMAVEVVSLGAGATPDLSVGIASGTHATDADSITAHLFLHVDGNSSAIRFQSKDGTHTTLSTDSTVTLTAGTRFEVWLDTRNPAACAIYVNGVRVLSGTTFDISAGASNWFLLAHLEKTSSADVFECDIDWLRARFADQ